MLGLAMDIERRTVGPFLDEDDMAWALLILEQVMGDAQRLRPVFSTSSR